jgi:hypothetical protein
MKKQKKAGRPPIDPSKKARNRNLAFNDADWANLTKLGRAKWIRTKMQEEQNANTDRSKAN